MANKEVSLDFFVRSFCCVVALRRIFAGVFPIPLTMAYLQETITPYGTGEQKAKQVERMFDNIAPRYDLLNHLLSFGIDRHWRRAAVDSLKSYHPRKILDVATGTGDFALLMTKRLSDVCVTGIDLSDEMLAVARRKLPEDKTGVLDFVKGDVLALPYETGTFDAVTVAYGARNFADLNSGLREMRRVLRPGGRLVIAGLAKDDRHHTSELLYGFPPKVVGLKPTDPLFHLLEQIQNEVHRFAITFHKDKRSKGTFRTQLTDIPGIGDKTARDLLLKFGSVKEVRLQTEADLAKVVGPAKAKAITAYFATQQ